MGGSGSGRYYFPGKKTKVEDCRTLDVRDFAKDGFITRGNVSGYTNWRNACNEITSSISWRFHNHGGYDVDFRLIYAISRDENKEEFDYTVRLDHTFPFYGGVRWWFRCPLSRDGYDCQRRVAKLYLPPGGRYFGCRHCYNLTYKSCQESHKLERSAIFGGFMGFCNLDTKIELLHRKIKRWSHKGRPTKKASKFFRMVREMETLYGNIDEEAISRGIESWKEEK